MRARTIVVGAGIAGLSTAWALARRGARDVVVVDAAERVGTQATAQNAAILRTPMLDAVGEELGREGAAFLRAPPVDFADRPLLDACGLLLVCQRGSAGERTWSQQLARHGDDVRELPDKQLAAIAPHVRREDARGFLLPGEGRIELAALVAAFERAARTLGVKFVLGVRVRAILPQGRGVQLADGRVIEGERVVLAAGAWAQELAARAGSRIELQPTRRHLLVTRASQDVDPRWPVVWRDDDPFYARPEAGGLMVSACDEEPVRPAQLHAERAQLERAMDMSKRHLELRGELQPARFWAGIRTHAADARFVIGPDPDVEGVVWCGALGGHGITCAEPAGRIAADWIQDGASSHPLAGELHPARFAAPQIVAVV